VSVLSKCVVRTFCPLKLCRVSLAVTAITFCSGQCILDVFFLITNVLYLIFLSPVLFCVVHVYRWPCVPPTPTSAAAWVPARAPPRSSPSSMSLALAACSRSTSTAMLLIMVRYL
jgi:hypothetical protein